MITQLDENQQVNVHPDRMVAKLRQQLITQGQAHGAQLGEMHARIAELEAIITQLVVDQHTPTEPDAPAGQAPNAAAG
jgi:hypothetical protein